MTRVLVLGAGFAGLWAAAGAARKLDETGRVERNVEILVVDRNPYHNIRVRNYEIELREVAIPLGEVLDPIGVKHVTAEVKTIDIAQKQVRIATRGCEEALSLTTESLLHSAVNCDARALPGSAQTVLTWIPIPRPCS